MVFDIVEECFTVQLLNPAAADVTEKLIDDAANFQEEMLSKISAAKTKVDFRSVVQTIEDKAIDFITKLNALNEK